jgi:inner membrane protein
MENLCHTLVGAAFGETGLKRGTRWGNAVLMIAANLPDIDVLSYATDTPAVALRRGMTHGVLAQALLPILFTGLVLLLDRWRPPSGAGQRARAAPVLLLSYLGVLSHVALDWLNNYGIRLLMPFSDHWFYGDAVFIVDPWLWVIFGFGILLARRRSLRWTAAASLVVASVYIGGMVWSARIAREQVLDRWTREQGRPPRALMVGPSFANPLLKSIIVDAGDHYRTGRFGWPRAVELDARRIPKNEDHPAVVAARDDRRVRAVLVWARFPYYQLTPSAEGTQVSLRDLRFPARVGGVTVLVR